MFQTAHQKYFHSRHAHDRACGLRLVSLEERSSGRRPPIIRLLHLQSSWLNRERPADHHRSWRVTVPSRRRCPSYTPCFERPSGAFSLGQRYGASSEMRGAACCLMAHQPVIIRMWNALTRGARANQFGVGRGFHAQCWGGNGLIRRYFEATKTAAKAGDTTAQMCYVLGGLPTREGDFVYTEAEIVEY